MTKKRSKITRIFRENLNAHKRIVVNIGGARSSKSYSVCQVLAYKLRKEYGKEIGICRKTMPALKMTTYRDMTGILSNWGTLPFCHEQKSEHWIKYHPHNNHLQFFSIEDPTRIKSTKFHYIFIEEADEFTKDDFTILDTRLSGTNTNPNERNHIYLALNPENIHGWIPEYLLKRPDVQVIKSNYKDNPFLDDEYIQTLESLKHIDQNAYRVYTLGEWGKTEGLIYTNYDLVDEMPPLDSGELIFGLDFGYNNPTALIEILIKDNEVFVNEKLYEEKLITADLIDKIKTLVPDSTSEIFADTAEPDKIEEIKRAGFNIHPSEKSVRDGINFLKKFRLHITKNSGNLIKEIRGYAWKKDKDGKAIDEPIKFRDHALDALRYACYTKLKNFVRDDTGIFGGIKT